MKLNQDFKLKSGILKTMRFESLNAILNTIKCITIDISTGISHIINLCEVSKYDNMI